MKIILPTAFALVLFATPSFANTLTCAPGSGHLNITNDAAGRTIVTCSKGAAWATKVKAFRKKAARRG